MGYLEDVLEQLKAQGFRAELGHPGRWAVRVTEPLAAVCGSGFDYDRAQAQVTVAVLSPRSLGLSGCVSLANRAVGCLVGFGTGWSYQGWQFDSDLDCYRAEVTGQVTVAFSGSSLVRVSGWQVAIGEEQQGYVTDFLARQQGDRRFVRPHGVPEPVGVTPPVGGWLIRLTQRLPLYEPEPEPGEEPFTLTVTGGENSQIYHDCCWSDYSARKQPGCTLVVRSGFALSREVI